MDSRRFTIYAIVCLSYALRYATHAIYCEAAIVSDDANITRLYGYCYGYVARRYYDGDEPRSLLRDTMIGCLVLHTNTSFMVIFTHHYATLLMFAAVGWFVRAWRRITASLRRRRWLCYTI